VVKRTCLVLFCTVLVQAWTPAHAHAWWEVIEKLSGPGPFRGWSFEARLVCLVDPDGEGPGRFGARLPSPIESIAASCETNDPEIRRAAIDINMRFLKRDDDVRFANGEQINLTTFAPSISWNIIPNPEWDVVDVGVAAGAFWITSTEFPSVKGGFLEPVRFDFHAPSRFKQTHPLAALIPRVRVGWLVFPAGFEPNAFAAAAPQRISRDWPMNVAIFADLEPVLKFLR
jgi:hypothetical protein